MLKVRLTLLRERQLMHSRLDMCTSCARWVCMGVGLNIDNFLSLPEIFCYVGLRRMRTWTPRCTRLQTFLTLCMDRSGTGECPETKHSCAPLLMCCEKACQQFCHMKGASLWWSYSRPGKVRASLRILCFSAEISVFLRYVQDPPFP